MIKFNKSAYSEKTLEYLSCVLESGQTSGDGKYTKLCSEWFMQKLMCECALVVNSATSALEMSAILANIGKDDEVIMPSYTFCSTANAFVLRGAVPVFVDISPDTLDIDEAKIEEAITPKTRAIVPVHYAGVACEMDTIMDIARRHNLLVIEDGAQAFDSFYKGRPLGTLGDMGCFSFHETKNITSGEGGLFLTNNKSLAERAEIVREKGTNRAKFFKGQVDKYTWVDCGSSYLPSDLIGAYLYSMLEMADVIQAGRKKIWDKYFSAFESLEEQKKLRLPRIPGYATNNAHIFYLLLENRDVRDELIRYLKDNNIQATFHYVPLHNSPAGQRYCKVAGNLSITEKIAETLVRLPLYYGLKDWEVDKVIETVVKFFKK